MSWVISDSLGGLEHTVTGPLEQMASALFVCWDEALGQRVQVDELHPRT